MTFVRGLLAVLAGILVTGIIGAAYDYLRPGVILDPVNTKFLYPWITGLSGGFGAAVAVLIYGASTPRSASERPAPRPRPVREPKRAAKAEPKPAAKPQPDTSSEVPGMPTFDFDKAKTETGDKPKEQQ